MYGNLICHKLDENHKFWAGNLPDDLYLTEEEFNILWNIHPCNFHEIKMHGRLVKTPLWQQAYGIDL